MVAGAVTYDYYYDEGTLVYQEKSDNTSIHFLTEVGSEYLGFRYSGTTYFYAKNAQGDIIGILNSAGNFIARYRYDAWGVPIAITDGNGNDVSNNQSHIANINPIRYRGYYYDVETGFYYLQSRYYDPVTCRMLNADGAVSTGTGVLGHNMFAYCNNNPVMLSDPDGTCPICGLALCVSCNKAKEAAPIYNPYKLTLPKKPASSKVDASSLISINGSNPKAPVQVIIAPEHEKNGKLDPNITIEDSYRITSEKARSNVLDYIIASPEFDPNVFTRGKDAWMNEWLGHNFLYHYHVFRDNTASVDFNENEWIPWDIIDGYNY